MNIASKIALSALALVAATTATAASAQDYLDWSSMAPGGLEMVDPYGNVYTVDPWASDSQVDAYGNVVSSYGYQMDESLGMYDLTPAWQDNSYGYGATTDSYSYLDSNPYAGATTSHDKFLESIWE
ncbi:MAG: hypothetical protein AAF216_03545 [Pseudomonadota bacterium]